MDAYIINEIKKREREKLERENRPSLRIPFGPPPGWEPPPGERQPVRQPHVPKHDDPHYRM